MLIAWPRCTKNAVSAAPFFGSGSFLWATVFACFLMTTALGHERDIADASAWLTELSPGDRATPACYAKAGALPRQRFRSTPDAGCVPLVQPNWAFFDTSLPRSAPQVLVIPQVSRCFDNQPANPPTPAGCPTNRQLILTMDRQAVLDWLK